MNSFPILIIIIPALYAIFSYTNANPMLFIYGCLLCIILQLIIFCAFCLFQLNRTYSQAHSITMTKNYSLNPQAEYPLVILPRVQKMFFNRYTEEARVFDNKKSLKLSNVPSYYYEDTDIDQQPRKATMRFLNQILGYCKTLSRFNDILVIFGKYLYDIEDDSVIGKKKYYHAIFEAPYRSQIDLSELIDEERDIFYRTKTKLKLKKQTQKLLFPTWKLIIKAIRFIGLEYQKMDQMKKSNAEMLEMVHKKILEDYNLIENKIIVLSKNLDETCKNLQILKKDYEKYQSEIIRGDENVAPHNEMIDWFRKQFYQFRDLERRIRENQSNFKDQTRKIKYYKQKLAGFADQNRQKYLKLLKTRFIAFIDSYYITIDESLKKIQEIFCYNQQQVTQRSPKVNRLQTYKNMNEALEAQKVYQKQYFLRIKYYDEKLDGILKSIASIQEFLTYMKNTFAMLAKNLRELRQKQQRVVKYFIKFIMHLTEKCIEVQTEINKLYEANEKVNYWNRAQVMSIKITLKKKMKQSSELLSGIDVTDGPILYKYKVAKAQLEQNYKEMQEKIANIIEFQSLYLRHSGRVKKILLVSLVNFLNYQKGLLKFGQIDQKNINDTDYDINDDNFLENENKDNYHDATMTNNEWDFLEGNSLQTGRTLAPCYLKIINSFLFVTYIEWKNGQHFKSKIMKQLFIILNIDPVESFSKIEVYNMEFYGLPPEVVWIKQLKTEDKQAFIDLHFTLKGVISLNIKTLYKLFRTIVPIDVKVQIEQFYCVARLCFVPSYIGGGWLSFIGEPITKFNIIPSIGSYKLDMETLKNLINNFLTNKLKQNTYPIKKHLSIPMSKKQQKDIQAIQERFRNSDNMFN